MIVLLWFVSLAIMAESLDIGHLTQHRIPPRNKGWHLLHFQFAIKMCVREREIVRDGVRLSCQNR